MGERLVIMGLLALSALAFGDVRVSGHVTSDTNAPVANATIQLTSAAGMRYRALSDPTGSFSVTVRNDGDYVIDIEHSGFFSLNNRHVSVIAPETDLKLVLNPLREFAESVDVASSSTAVALDQTTSNEKLTGAELLDVPFPTTHNLRNALRLLPGLVQDNSGGIHVNGGAENQVQYLLDGFNVADPLTGAFESRISVEAVQSVDVQSGRVSAEYGKGSAGVVSVNTKMGDDRIRYSATNFVPGVENSKGWRIGSWNPRFNVSGPLRRGKAWFSDSLTMQYDQTVIRDLPSGQDASSSWRYSNLLRGQVNITPSNILFASFLANQWSARRTGLSALDPPETTVDRRSRQWFADIKDQIYFGHGALIEFGYASNRTFLRAIPQGHELYVLTPNGRRGNFFIDGLQGGSRNQILANAFLPSFTWFGGHQIKAGIEADRLGYSQDIERTGFEWYSAQSLIRRVIYTGNGRLGQTNFETAAYVQDSWRLRPNVLLELGLRGDWDRLLGNWNTSPRIGLAWSPFGLENTKISAGYAITYDATSLELFTRAYDQMPLTTYYPPYGPGDQPVRSLFVIPGGHFASPRYSTWSASLDQRMYSSIYLRAQAMRRRGDRGLGYSDVNTTGDQIYMLGNRRSDDYDSVEFTVRQNLRKQYEWMASYTRSRAASSQVIDPASDDPAIVLNNFGRLPWDTPNRIMSWGYLPTRWENWAIAYLAEYRTGFPFSVQDDAGHILGAVNSMRYPDFFELNLHIERKFRFHGQLWAGRAGFNNITNHKNPNSVNNDLNSDQFLRFYGGQTRALNFRIRWLGKL
jgi:hypothetical protein